MNIATLGMSIQSINWFAIVIMAIGLICIIIEIFQPGFGVFGVIGTILLVVGIIYSSATYEGDNLIGFIGILLGISVLVIIIALVAMVISLRTGLLSKTGLVSKSTAVDNEISKGTEDYTFLIGKCGIVESELRPCGSVSIDNNIYDVTAEKQFIEKGKSVTVISVEGIKIIVKEKYLEDK